MSSSDQKHFVNNFIFTLKGGKHPDQAISTKDLTSLQFLTFLAFSRTPGLREDPSNLGNAIALSQISKILGDEKNVKNTSSQSTSVHT